VTAGLARVDAATGAASSRKKGEAAFRRWRGQGGGKNKYEQSGGAYNRYCQSHSATTLERLTDAALC